MLNIYLVLFHELSIFFVYCRTYIHWLLKLRLPWQPAFFLKEASRTIYLNTVWWILTQPFQSVYFFILIIFQVELAKNAQSILSLWSILTWFSQRWVNAQSTLLSIKLIINFLSSKKWAISNKNKPKFQLVEICSN